MYNENRGREREQPNFVCKIFCYVAINLHVVYINVHENYYHRINPWCWLKSEQCVCVCVYSEWVNEAKRSKTIETKKKQNRTRWIAECVHTQWIWYDNGRYDESAKAMKIDQITKMYCVCVALSLSIIDYIL